MCTASQRSKQVSLFLQKSLIVVIRLGSKWASAFWKHFWNIWIFILLLIENDSALKVAEQIPFRGFVIYKPVANKKECNLIPPYAYVFFMLVVKT